MKSKDVTCMVCARLNSERVHQKMIRPFADSSLLEIALNKLQSCDFLDKEKIYLSAIEPEIKAVGEKLGIKIYNRKIESTYEPNTMDVLYSWLHDIKPVYVLEINACNPLLSPETINRALDYFNKNDLESLFGIIRRQNFYYRSDSSLINHFNGDKKYLPTLETKMVEPIFEAAHSIYLWKAERVIKEGIRWANKPNDPFLFEVPPEEAFDIDWPWQFELAEQMYLKKMNKK